MRSLPRSYRAATTFGLVALLAGSLVSEVGAANKGPSSFPASPTSSIKADLDGNDIFDDLEGRLAGANQDEQIPIIVTLHEVVTAPALENLLNMVGPFQVTHRFSVINGFAATATPAQIKLLANIPGVAQVEEDSIVHTTNASAQTSFGVTKARTDLPGLDGNADGNASLYSKDDLVAAVIDTGIDPNHLDLNDGKVIAFKDYVGGKTDPYDNNGHGTHVAATIAGDGEAGAGGVNRGVAPGAALVGVKVLDVNGSGSMANVTAAIDWVVTNKATYGIEAINLSLSTSGCSNGSDATSQAVNNASAAGIVVVVAAGNAGPGTCTIASPGAAQNAITVGAMADLGVGGFSLANFSSRGPTADNRIKPDVVGPGVGITSADAGTTNGYLTYSGTSMATPFVVGTALLMRDISAGLTPQQVKAAITSSAIDWGRGGNNTTAGSTGADIDYGAGRLDSYAALASVGAALTSPPAAPAHKRFDGNLSGTGAKTDITLTITDTSFPLAATLIEPSVTGPRASAPDFDLMLFAPNGSQVAIAETDKRQEAMSINPVAGNYVLRVVSYNGSGPWFVDVSAGLGTSPPLPASVLLKPTSTKVLTGSLASGGPAQLAADDNAYVLVNSNKAFTRTATWQAGIADVPRNATNLDITYKGKNSRNCTQKIHLWRWSDSTWVQVDSRTVGATEVLIADLTPTGVLSNYVSGSGASGEVITRVQCKTTSGTFATSGDLLQLTYTTP